ncbi:MAG: LysR family substrate-binding domain-containing protein, partial [Cyanobacteria bacterium]|nr:LysR family substrate-binding domain-containing protein [Cyanobacteriota bacterium]
FERLPRGVRLSPAGHTLLERSKQLLNDLDRAVAATRLVGEGKTGFLKVGFADGATFSGHVPAIVREFRKANPGIELELIPASSLTQAEMLQNQSIDVGFVYWVPDGKEISHQAVNQERIVLAVAETNKLSSKKSLSLKDLDGKPFVWFKRSYSPKYYDLILSHCSRAGLTLNVVQEATAESTMLSLVSADIGATFITESAKRRKPDNVVLIKVLDLTATLTVNAIWRNNDRNPAVTKFVQALKKHCSSAPRANRKKQKN